MAHLVHAALTAPAQALCRNLAVLALALALAPSAVEASPLDAVVGVHAEIPADARTAEVLGTEREGAGIVIGDDGLVLTIGYLIMESVSAQIELPGGRKVPAEVVAYDYDSGFGLLRALSAIDIEPVEFGDSDPLEEQDKVIVAGFGGLEAALPAYVVSRRDFAGYWEYLLPKAIFTSPPHPGFGGAALIGSDGRLLGVGSLIVRDAAREPETLPGNMFVPIDALKPIYDQLLAQGRSPEPARPWLGLYSEEVRGRIFVQRVAPEGPAAAAGLRANDVIVAVDGDSVSTLADFYRKVWALGEAGVEVPLRVLSEAGLREISVSSGDRYDYLRLNPTY